MRIARIAPSIDRTRAAFLLSFMVAVGALVVSSMMASKVLSGIRAYVGGEGLWSKAEKDAALHLTNYATNVDRAELEAFRASLSVPLGDRIARVELEKPQPDFDRAARGFRQGRNAKDDVSTMIWLFRRFRRLAYMDRAIAIWARGDQEIARLDQLGQEVRRIGEAREFTEGSRREALRRIGELNSRLTILEDEFSFTLGEAARWLQGILLRTLLIVATMLLAAAAVVSHRLGRLFHAERIALRESETQYRSLFERNLAGVYRSTADGRLLECNEAFARIFGFASRDEALASTAWDLYENREIRQAYLDRLRTERVLTNQEVRLRRHDGSSVWVLENGTFTDESSGQSVIDGTIVEISGLKEAEEKIAHQAFHDGLTGLPNRRLFSDRLDLALSRAKGSGTRVAVLFLDLDHFKRVNDTLGHGVGDELLRRIAVRLAESVREIDTVARIGGDEFLLFFPNLKTDEAHVRIAEKLLSRLAESHEVDGHHLYATASIGVSLFPSDGSDPESLVMSADRAMYRAKEFGRNNFQVSTPAMAATSKQSFSVESGLREALERGELRLEYQPILDLKSDEILGAEALIRWIHPEKGLLEPKLFVPVAEESALILPIGKWVLESACRQASEWSGNSTRPLSVSVNVSSIQFRRGDLLNTVAGALRESRLDPARLTLEITEAVAIHDEVLAKRILQGVREMGVQVAIDDFGTGYASLVYLKRFPITHIKLDQSFVQDVNDDLVDRAIIESMIDLAHSLGLRVIAEGVETREQRAELQRLGCDEYQGYLVSRSIGGAEIAAMADRSSPRE